MRGVVIAPTKFNDGLIGTAGEVDPDQQLGSQRNETCSVAGNRSKKCIKVQRPSRSVGAAFSLFLDTRRHLE